MWKNFHVSKKINKIILKNRPEFEPPVCLLSFPNNPLLFEPKVINSPCNLRLQKLNYSLDFRKK